MCSLWCFDAALLSKEIAVDTVKLIDPVITLEVMKDGTGSWVNQKMAALEKVKDLAGDDAAKMIDSTVNKAAGDALGAIVLNSVKIENGSLSFIDHQKDAQHNIQDINLAMRASTLKGPYDLKGSLTANDLPALSMVLILPLTLTYILILSLISSNPTAEAVHHLLFCDNFSAKSEIRNKK